MPAPDFDAIEAGTTATGAVKARARIPWRFLGNRVLFYLFTLWAAITINFFLFRVLPGDAITDLSRVPHASPALRHALLVQFGLDKPKWEQYLIYLKNLAHGNLGISFASQQPVSHLLLADLKNKGVRAVAAS